MSLRTREHSTLSFTIVLFLFLCSPSGAQNPTIDSLLSALENSRSDREKVEIYHALWEATAYSQPDSTLSYAMQALEISRSMNDPFWIGRSLIKAGAYYNLHGDQALSDDYYRQALIEFRKGDYPKQEGLALHNLGVNQQSRDDLDSALVLFGESLEIGEDINDQELIQFNYQGIGIIYERKGYYNLAIENLLKSIDMAIARGDELSEADGWVALGNLYSYNKEYRKGIEAYERSIDLYERNNDDFFLAQTTNNLANDFIEVGAGTDTIIATLEKSIALAQKTNNTFIEGLSTRLMGQVFFKSGDLDRAEALYRKSLALNRSYGHHRNMAGDYTVMAKLEQAEGDLSGALNRLDSARWHLAKIQAPLEVQEMYFNYSEVYQELGRHEEALEAYRKYVHLKDSLFTIEKNRQYEELGIIYETEKKNKEIALLQKNAELDATRKKALGGGLILLGILSISIIYGQYQKRRRDRKILIQEKELEMEKRKNAEQELVFKKKELTSKILQLARKNEFLSSLQEEIAELRQTPDSQVKHTSRKIVRMIQNDAMNEDAWDQFLLEFQSIHQDFIQALNEEYGPFSKSETRLIFLLKMNFSSKEIANTLRISPAGIKKARHRLRKKINLDTDTDLQSFLLSFSPQEALS